MPDGHPKVEKFKQIVYHTRVAERHLVRSLEDTLNKTGLAERQAAFEEEAPKLAVSVAERAMDSVGAKPSDIGFVLAVCATAPSSMMPGIDQVVVNNLKLPRNVVALSVSQWGCRGGGAALSLARNFLIANPTSNALVVMVETCSLLYQPSDMNDEKVLQPAVICNALFGDAAGSCIISGTQSRLLKNPWIGGVRMELGDSGCHQLPNSLEYMNYETSDNGMHFRLTNMVPKAMSQVAPVVVQFMIDHGLTPADFANMSFLLHTGGPKVLHHFMQVVTKVEDPESDIEDGSLDPRVTHAMDTLCKYGNVASVSLLSTLKGRMSDGLVNMDSQRCLVAGCGPGMGADWLMCNLVRHPAGAQEKATKNVADCAPLAKKACVGAADDTAVAVGAAASAS